MQRFLPVANVSFMEAQLQRFSDPPAVIHDGWLVPKADIALSQKRALKSM
jgi:hypothetical protein